MGVIFLLWANEGEGKTFARRLGVDICHEEMEKRHFRLLARTIVFAMTRCFGMTWYHLKKKRNICSA